MVADWMVLGTWVMAIGTFIMIVLSCKQFKHMRKQGEKPVILDLIRYVISPFLHDIRDVIKEPRDV